MMENNQNIVYIFLYIILFLGLASIAFALFVFKSNKKIFEKELENKELKNKFQQESLNLILTTEEEERSRIAQDLHDEVSSKINIVFFQSNMLLDGNIKQEDVKEITQNIVEVSRAIQENARSIAHNLLPPILQKFGLHQAIIELVSEQENHLLKINYEISMI